MGVPGPEPNLIMGNLGEFGKGMHLYDMECTKKYGPTFGLDLKFVSGEKFFLDHIC